MSVQVPKGYQQTEVGVIPEDWSLLSLQEISHIATGNTPPTSNPKNYGDEFLFVSPGDIGNKKLIENTEKKLSSTGFSISRKFPAGSILFVCIGSTIGKCGIASVTLTSNQQINAVFPSIKNSNEFIYYALCSVASKIKDMAGEQAVPLVNKSQFSQAKIPIPSLGEQQAIAEALSDADALIESLEQLIAKKRQIKQGAMQELLTSQRRLPGFGGEWFLKSVRELGEVITGGTPSTARTDFWGGTIPWVTPTDIKDVRDIFITERSLTVEGSKELKLLPANTVLVTCIASIGKNAILRNPGASNQQINAVIPNKESSAEFLYYLFEFNKAYLQGNAGTTATSILSKAKFQELTFSVPQIQEQLAISEFLSDIDEEISGLVNQLQKSRQIKQAMMQELLTGRIRLI